MENYSNILMTDGIDMRDIYGRSLSISAEKIEWLAAAFLKETGLNPSEAELVQEFRTSSIAWYFRKREYKRA